MNDRAQRLFKFIRKTVTTRTKTTYDFNKYEQVLLLEEIPEDKKRCHLICRGESVDLFNDVWLSVQKFDEPVRPQYPEICQRWLDESPEDEFALPALHPSIIVVIDSEQIDQDIVSDEIEELHLSDYPEISELWDSYIEDAWKPWIESHKHWLSIQEVYEHLFGIQQQQKKLGEQFELVVGVGLLSHNDGTTKLIRRHLLTQRVELAFSTQQGMFEIRAHESDLEINLELDMVGDRRPPREITEHVETQLAGDDADLWDTSFTKPILKTVIQSIYADGQYDSQEMSSPTPTKRHQVTFSPTLILRKKNTRGLITTLDKIVDQLNGDVEIPPCLLTLLDDDTPEASENSTDSTGNDSTNPQTLDGEVYFPLSSNEQQKKILSRYETHDGVVVQGPPGTGKSHTIANLISHLLAKGNKVLVTAQSPRALSVLQDKLPVELQGLCVSLLGNGPQETKNLEYSIETLINLREQWSGRESELVSLVQSEREKLHKTRSLLSKTRNDLRELALRESNQAEIANGYAGYPYQIAKRVKENASQFHWFHDQIPSNSTFPCDQSTLEQLAEALPKMPQDIINQMEYNFPSESELQLCQQYHRAFDERHVFKEQLKTLPPFCDPVPNNLNNLAIEELDLAISDLEALERQRNELTSNDQWMEQVITDCLDGKQHAWSDIATDIKMRLTGKIENLPELSAQNIELPSNFTVKRLKQCVYDVLTHFKNGGKLRKWGLLTPKVIKENWETITACTIDGRKCSTTDDLETLHEFLTAVYALNGARKRMSGWIDLSNLDTMDLFRKIQTIQKRIIAILYVHTQLHEYYRNFGFADLTEQKKIWEPSASEYALTVIKTTIINKRIDSANATISDVLGVIGKLKDSSNPHPLIGDLYIALDERDPKRFTCVLQKLSELSKNKRDFLFVENTLSSISLGAPLLAAQMRTTASAEDWKQQIPEIANAWHWSQAQSWLADYLKLSKNTLKADNKRLADDEQNSLMRLAELQATQSCLERLTIEKIRALLAWQNSVSKLGKGTGKYSPLHRRNARRALEMCRDAIPAWIMPLAKLFETTSPKPGMFDVIIVDEASQCNLDSLLLYYIGKKVIVVGDPEQISPLAVGQNMSVVNELANEYLHDFHPLIKQSFDLTTSLHDFAKLLFPDSDLVLLEHFRSVPQIISYSNNLSYKNRLIPLRQPPHQPLSPLEHRFVSEGYREGEGAKAYNQAEADHICQQIQQCCNDPAYAEKSIGVISLQGIGQANLIQERLLELIGASKIEEHNIMCGDPYSFQGDERDIIFLSMVIGSNRRHNTLTMKKFQQRYNVAASRAKDQMWLFYSVKREDLNPNGLRRQLLEHFIEPDRFTPTISGIDNISELQQLAVAKGRENGTQPAPFDSWFEVDVALELAQRGYLVRPQYPSGGKFIDLVIEDSGNKLAIECHGPHHLQAEQIESDEARQQLLERIGWQFHIIWATNFYADRESIIEGVINDLTSRSIFPRGYAPPSEISPKLDHTPATTDRNKPAITFAEDEPDFPTVKTDAVPTTRSPVVESETTILSLTRPLPDPRAGDPDVVSAALVQIITDYGPLPQKAVYRIYKEYSTINKVTKPVRLSLRKAIRKLRNSNTILSVDEYDNRNLDHMILRCADAEEIRLREVGSRERFEDIPPSEIALVMLNHTRERGAVGRLNKRHLIYPVLHFYGFEKLTSRREPIFDAAYEIYCQKIREDLGVSSETNNTVSTALAGSV